MKTITFFEHQSRAYADIGLTPDHPSIEQVERLNGLFGAELSPFSSLVC